MTHATVPSEPVQKPPAANAQRDLLLEAQLGSTTVQLTGDTSITGVIEQVIAIEQQQGTATDLCVPGSQVQCTTGLLGADAHPLTLVIAQGHDGKHGGVIERIKRELLTVRVERQAGEFLQLFG